ncbi:uncharacterized protein LOC129317219 [Prosopis cineraria]|uniref:uncharacterized protein LOC129301200 n=1 Tax=Prosopis cineraria TaxID=364024 RepID=UPI00240EA4B5|nr:uncharacterized protein LOC129301200 [Prosopis cineraria]XP_054817562.1 uncharacterized protein LOC129317219 [Prosopis cineraria]
MSMSLPDCPLPLCVYESGCLSEAAAAWSTEPWPALFLRVRQGDPLSPYLFIIASKVLSFTLSAHANNGVVQGISLTEECPMLTHYLFADDTMLFLNASRSNCSAIKEILDSYCNASEEVYSFLGVSTVDNPGVYLGLPILWGRSKIAALAHVLDKVGKKIHGWKSKLLTFVGKEVLIKPVVNVVPIFLMTSFKFPKRTCSELDSLMANFFWGHNDTKNNIHWRSWSKLCAPKKEGSLGFRDFMNFNDALLAKTAWRVLSNPGHLWAKDLSTVSHAMTPETTSCFENILIPRNISADTTIWHGAKKGNYTSKLGYRLNYARDHPVSIPDATTSSPLPQGIWNDIWKLKIFPKVKHFMWRAFHRALATKEALHARKCSPDLSYPIYNNPLDGFGKAYIACICWNIWKTRFAKVFSASEINPIHVISLTNASVNEFWKIHGEKDSCSPVSNLPTQWKPPSVGKFKFNCDGAYSAVSKKAAIGILWRDHLGKFIKGWQEPVTASSSLMAEFFALRKAVQVAIDSHITKAVSELDCLDWCRVLSSLDLSYSHWSHHSPLEEFFDIIRLFPAFSFSFVKREGNSATDWLAVSSLKGVEPSGWVLCSSLPLLDILAYNSNGVAQDFTQPLSSKDREGIS